MHSHNSFMHSFIHSGHFYSASSSPLLGLLRGAPDCSTDIVSEFHAEAHRQLAQGPYVVARAGVEPTTLRLRVIDLTNVPPCPTNFKLSSLTGLGLASAVPRWLEKWGIGNQISALSFDMTTSNTCPQAGACAFVATT